MSLATRRELSCNRWTELPMPCNAISRVNALGLKQAMPKTLAFADRFGHKILDNDNGVDNEQDSDYDPSDDSSQSTQSSVSTASLASSNSDDSDDDNDDDDDDGDT